jgi:hypothetical protein
MGLRRKERGGGGLKILKTISEALAINCALSFGSRGSGGGAGSKLLLSSLSLAGNDR